MGLSRGKRGQVLATDATTRRGNDGPGTDSRAPMHRNHPTVPAKRPPWQLHRSRCCPEPDGERHGRVVEAAAEGVDLLRADAAAAVVVVDLDDR